MKFLFTIVLLFGVIGFSATSWGQSIRVGSKAFTEGYLLGELAAQTLESSTSVPVTRHFGLGNTGVVFEALKKGEIDVYAEYTGTISEAILQEPLLRDREGLETRLRAQGFLISQPLGFDNTYALAVTRDFSDAHAVKRISDLAKVSNQVRSAFSHEFASRSDGLPNLQKRYRIDLSGRRQSMAHSLAFEAIRSGKVDLIDVYSTDAKIESMDLVVLQDDLGYFPKYQAVWLARSEFVEKHPEMWKQLEAMTGTIDAGQMRRLNAGVESEKKSFAQVVGEYLNQTDNREVFTGPTVIARIWQRTQEHALLVGVTVFLSILTGVPLGILAARREKLGRVLLLVASIVQTIPSLALLCLLIPVFGIGLVPALVALYLYSLLPILLNTFVGLRSIDARLIETARALGLSSMRTLWSIELPLASRSIIAGVQTSTVIGIGTATLAALIGAGGYGVPIVSGLAINDTKTILVGAIPAALMSLVAYFCFELLERIATPKGLRTKLS